jgi:2,4-dienoyl-CoA reductase-like NADH-dependent reductase (Old Yellow Enzyme family)
MPLAPSRVINNYGLLRGRGFARAMKERDLLKTRRDFVRAAVIVKQAGFDAIEVHMGHGYLLSQFLTPAINKRKDRYGGTLENRMRFPLEVVTDIINAVGSDYPVICKINLNDDFKGGLTPEESIFVAKELEKAGVAALALSGGYTSKTPFYLMRGDIPLWNMVKAENNFLQKLVMAVFGRMIIRKYEFRENFFLPLAKKVRAQLKLPLVYVGGVCSSKGLIEIMEEGFDLIAIGRALIHDPDFIKQMENDNEYISPCNHCNICVAEMEKSGVRCVLA